MGRIRFAWLALVAILVLAACQSVSEIDGVALTAEADTEVEALAVATPWKGWYDWFVIEFVWPDDGDLTFGGRCATPSDYLIRSEGPGRLSHMGRITFTTDHCTQLATGTHDGVMTFVAPDGSSVVTTYTGYGIPETEAYVFVTDFTIVGGTGRFAGSTGGGPCHATGLRGRVGRRPGPDPDAAVDGRSHHLRTGEGPGALTAASGGDSGIERRIHTTLPS